MEKMDLRKKYLLPFFFFASARQSLPLISTNFVSTLMWRAHAFKAFIKFQTQKLIIQQKYNLLSPPSVPQSNPWIHTNTRKHNSSSFPGPLIVLQKIRRWQDEACTQRALSAVTRKQSHLALSTQVITTWKDQALRKAPRDGSKTMPCSPAACFSFHELLSHHGYSWSVFVILSASLYKCQPLMLALFMFIYKPISKPKHLL